MSDQPDLKALAQFGEKWRDWLNSKQYHQDFRDIFEAVSDRNSNDDPDFQSFRKIVESVFGAIAKDHKYFGGAKPTQMVGKDSSGNPVWESVRSYVVDFPLALRPEFNPFADLQGSAHRHGQPADIGARMILSPTRRKDESVRLLGHLGFYFAPPAGRLMRDFEGIIALGKTCLGKAGDPDFMLDNSKKLPGWTWWTFGPEALINAPETWLEELAGNTREMFNTLGKALSPGGGGDAWVQSIRDLYQRPGADTQSGGETDESRDASKMDDEMNDTARLKRHLEAQPAVVLQGPPGTGKTRLALNLVELCAHEALDSTESLAVRLQKFRWTAVGNPLADDLGKSAWVDLPVLWEIVQLHPSYTYEDLVRGLTTKPTGAGVEFAVEDKLLVQLARAAAERADDKPTILILDEINRCNLSAVLGELILVLEKGYRDLPVRLQYSDPRRPGEATLTLPRNLWIIGTMNTADRSIAMVDFAIRRRFRFIDVLPDVEVVRTVNGARHGKEAADLAVGAFEAFEKLVSDRNLAIGHSYFLLEKDKDETDTKWKQQLRDRIEFEVIPLLREYAQEGFVRGDTESALRLLDPETALEDLRLQ